jgi:hypothetical protein
MTPHELARRLEEIASRLRNAQTGNEMAPLHDEIITILIAMSEWESRHTSRYDA